MMIRAGHLLILALAAGGGCSEPKKVDGYPPQFAGVGLELEVVDDRVLVIQPIAEGPADSAGIKAGDQILAINGKSTEGMSLGEVVTRLRGRPGSQLTLSLVRDDGKLVVVLRRSQLTKTDEGYKPN